MISHIVIRLCLALAIIALPLSSAQANLSYAPTEATDGTRFVLVTGEFAYDDDLDEFSAIVRRFSPSFVTFDSSGGNPMKAMELGRLIRGSGLSTIQLRGLECSSACSLAFMGGVTRSAEPGAIGVHKSSFTPGHGMNIDDAVSAVQHMVAEIMVYMNANGVDSDLLQLALKYEPGDMRYLSLSEMQQFGVVTDGTAGERAETAERPAPEARAPGVAVLPSPPARASTSLEVPEPRTGRVRHHAEWSR